ncbi:DUF1737 domain-containing protein [Jannaschia sp. KMU-145]|uniref:DUF1737 domain-containing protein n=1 Tax=Jannaschia halovivens TaxID=3388667 RepID=UPI00396B329C
MATLYRLLTGEDDSAFCHKVSAALAQGWVLHGAPAYAADPTSGVMRCAQAVTKDIDAEYGPDMKLGQQ